jgi:hypothetical protein
MHELIIIQMLAQCNYTSYSLGVLKKPYELKLSSLLTDLH